MKFIFAMRALAALFLSALLVACGGGSGTPAAPAQAALAYPIPSGLWAAPSGALPASGNYVYLQSDSGDFVGAGHTYTYTNANALSKVSNSGLKLTASVQGNQNWSGDFLLPSGAGTLQAGYFKGLTRSMSADKAVGGLDWNGNGNGCNTLTGWVVIDKIVLTGGTVTAVDLRFEQHCEGSSPALHGQIHWTNADADSSQVAGPAAIPAGLWRADAAHLPSAGNYLYLENPPSGSSPMAWAAYTPANAVFTLNASAAHLHLNVAGNQNWTAEFQGMQGLAQLAVGYYAGLQRYPFHNPVLGGMDVSGNGSCNALAGWFAVDNASYSGTTLTAVDLRFEETCDGGDVPLRGQLHWAAGDATSPSGPQNPPPAGLWAPGSAVSGLTGNYVYLASDPGDYIGGGRTELIKQDTAAISVVSNITAGMKVSAGNWTGYFVGMNMLSQLQPGYYGDLQRYPFQNPTRGGLEWTGSSGCNTISGWFVVDSVSYSMNELTAIDLRFEQHCEGAAPALHGAIHWTKG